MGWSFGCDHNHDNEPCNLEVEYCQLLGKVSRDGRKLTRKFIDHWDSSISKHDNTTCDQIETLVDNKCHPGLDNKIMFIQGNQSHEVLGVDEIC